MLAGVEGKFRLERGSSAGELTRRKEAAKVREHITEIEDMSILIHHRTIDQKRTL